jgi:copper oxidase (laccase) domain-containing protein
MLRLFEREFDRFRVGVVATGAAEGDIHPRRVDDATRERRELAATGALWTMLDQVHGTGVVDVDLSTGVGDAASLPVGDVARTEKPERRLAVWSADCAPVFLVGRRGALVGAHAGWRGLAAGIIDVACRALDQPVAAAVLGPVIHPCCYAFGHDELDRVAAGVGTEPPVVAGRTRLDGLALDVPAAVRAGLAAHDIALDVTGPCTGCDPGWFSHRVRGDRARQATVGWIDAPHDRRGDRR